MSLLERDDELAALDTVLIEGGVLVVEGGAGVGKTSLLAAASERAAELGHEVVRGRGSELEAGFAFGVVRQLFERRLALAGDEERGVLLRGPAAAAKTVLEGLPAGRVADDIAFAVLHGLYGLAANLAASRPLVVVVDDAQWADLPSLRWLAYLAARVEGLPISLVVGLRPSVPGDEAAPFAMIRAGAAVVRPGLLSEDAAVDLVRSVAGGQIDIHVCTALWRASGGNPFYLTELLRGIGSSSDYPSEKARLGVAHHVAVRIRRLDADALRLAQALAVLGDDCELRQAAVLAGMELDDSARLAAALVHLEILAGDSPIRFLHPIVRDSVEGSLTHGERDAAHRAAARLLHGSGAPQGRVGAHLVGLQPAADAWVAARLRDAAADALGSGAPQAAATLLTRALAEQPPASERAAMLLELGRAEVLAGQEAALSHLAEARELTEDRRRRAEIGLQMARAQADLFHWVEATDMCTSTLAELGESEPDLQARLEAQVVVSGLRVASRVSLVSPAFERLADLQPTGTAVATLLLARGMIGFWIEGQSAAEVRAPLEQAFARPSTLTENWDTLGPATWALVFAEGYETAKVVLAAMRTESERSGSTRALFTTFMTLGLLNARLGALPEADEAARIALRVLEGVGFDRGRLLLASVLIDTAIEAGQLDEAQAALDQLPTELESELSTTIALAARGRLRLAQGRPAEAVADFEQVRSLYSRENWGLEMRDNGFMHARSSEAVALLRLGEREQARELAAQELADARAFGAPRALGIALRVAGLTLTHDAATVLLEESVAVLQGSPARLERGHSLCELGAALRRSGRRADARAPLAEALDLAAHCGARALAVRAREELKACGARPRNEWRTGVEALTPRELHVARLAAEGRTNREIAQALYVTLKTVEGHLARVYAKLSITSRSELRQGLDGEKTRVPTP